MPTYQYACTECGHAFEQFQSFSDDALTTCPECAGRLRKLYSAVGVVFKGSGFYRTDSRAPETSGSSASSGSGSEKSDSGSGTTEKKSEPAAKKDTAGASASSGGSSSTKAAS